MANIPSLINLIKTYDNGLISVSDFENQYLAYFKAIESGEIDQRLFRILEDLFEDIDAYYPTWTEQDEKDFPYRITEKTLRKEIKRILAELEKYLLEK